MTRAARRDAGRPVLILSAFDPELAPLRRALRRRGVGPDRVVCLAAGIGAVDAAVGASRIMADVAPRIALFVGTAGSYAAQPRLGEAVVVRGLRLASSAVARGDGYLPAPLVTNASAAPRLRAALLRAAHNATKKSMKESTTARTRAAAAASSGRLVDVATPLAITRAAPLARRLAAHTGATVENLEVFAVARAARAARVPFGAVLGISNRVGPRAHLEWRRHQLAATESATAVVIEFLVGERVLDRNPRTQTLLKSISS